MIIIFDALLLLPFAQTADSSGHWVLGIGYEMRGEKKNANRCCAPKNIVKTTSSSSLQLKLSCLDSIAGFNSNSSFNNLIHE